ncbi:MAG: prolyl oligopeptidase family serine peptidase [Aliifodinibius sp.]|nr:prolyl oligopeptidase family serine peptidase [Fodinibius sp.]
MIFILSFIFFPGCSNVGKEQKFLEILGEFPEPVPLKVQIIEKTELENGERYKIEYVVEEADTLFDRPVDKVRAYLFVPEHGENEKLPAVVAIHQDGPFTHIGKSEPAGLAGNENLHYGFELFKRGYVVICPDRYYHAERRRIPNPGQAGSHMMRDLNLWLKWAGQLILNGRTHFGKEVYDLMRAVDVLYTYDFVDRDKIGAIGHSAGGNVLVYFMFVDQRVTVGVSSCGFYELLADFNDEDLSFSNSVFALPNLARVGKSADYLASIAPRPFLMTRGLHELESEAASKRHVEKTKAIERYARQSYQTLNAPENFKSIYFAGGHDFPPEIRDEVYAWFDEHLR